MPSRTAENLALLERETSALVGTAGRLRDADALGAPSLCVGWSRAHVLTHVARNADALQNLVAWAVDGRERAAYASEESRDADIEHGARRPAAEVVDDLEATAAAFAEAARALDGPAGEAQVRTRTGTPVTGAQVVGMRLVEVVFHHVDLAAGYTFDDADPGWVARSLSRGLRGWQATDDAPDLTVVPDGLEPVRLGAGGPEVAGTPGRLLLWLARGVDDGLRADRPLPSPPPWA